MYEVHEIGLATCKKCQNTWYIDSNSLTMKSGDKVNITKISINHCSACSDAMDKAQKSSTYRDTRIPRSNKK